MDDASRRIGLLVPGQGAITNSFDANDNLISIAQGTGTTTFTEDALNGTVTRTLPNGVTTDWAFDATAAGSVP